MTRADGPFGRSARPAVARDALMVLKARGIPVIFVSDDCADTLIALQHELGMSTPFVCRGGDVHIPRGYFSREWAPLALAWDSIQAGGVRDAIVMLTALYRAIDPSVIIVGLASRWSDRALLSEVDAPIIVRQSDGDADRLALEFSSAYVTHRTGPAGWREAVLGWEG